MTTPNEIKPAAPAEGLDGGRCAVDAGFGFCPDCGEALEHHDTFGNIDYCLDAIGHPRSEWSRPRQPKKAGDIFRCEKCECYWHSFDGQGELQSGYPC